MIAPALLRPLAGLALGALAGWICARIGTPIPWMLGPLITIALLRIAGIRVDAVPGGRQAGQWIVGTSLSLYFMPQVIAQVAGWWPLLLAGAAFAIVLGYAMGLTLARLAGIDRTTAIFASVPGSAAEMSVVGARFGARVDRVAAAQSLRMMIVVIAVPSLYAALGVHGADFFAPGMTVFSGPGFVVLMTATLVGGLVVSRLKVPNAFVLGPLAVAIPLTALEIDLSGVPSAARTPASVCSVAPSARGSSPISCGGRPVLSRRSRRAPQARCRRRRFSAGRPRT